MPAPEGVVVFVLRRAGASRLLWEPSSQEPASPRLAGTDRIRSNIGLLSHIVS
ncbi:Hypothetical predicted protein [Marmota monax]|uniref:Uncharacterized protein n=1 Tax=Marmota monax TaxID=9995 RepID=A0A5E4A3C9_MARMO|nr:hypothetical protein GHT09_005922 [Marmota monax]VTJ51539.1 Hypothetical predicted protein [Marmota monax]